MADVGEVRPQQGQPLRSGRHVVDDRAEDQEVVDVLSMLEHQHLAAGAKDPAGFLEDLFEGAVARDLMRAEAEDDHVAVGIGQGEGEGVGLQRLDPGVVDGRRLEVADVLVPRVLKLIAASPTFPVIEARIRPARRNQPLGWPESC